MSVTVVPTLSIGGVPVALSGTTAGLLAVDELKLTWGRATVLDAPTPATVALTLLDRTSSASTAARTDLIGQLLVLGWSASTGQTGVNFRGRITDAEASPRTAGGWLVDLAASSLEVDLGNYIIPAPTVWPEETFFARVDRCLALLPTGLLPGLARLPDSFARGATVRSINPSDTATQAAQLDVGGKSVLDVLRAVYASLSPQPMVYDPEAQRLDYPRRRQFRFGGYTPGMVTSVQLTADPGGVYRMSTPEGYRLDAGGLAYGGKLTQTIDGSVTRVETSFLDKGGAWKQTTAAGPTAAGAREATIGRRVLSVETMHGSGAAAIQLLQDWVDVIDHEATLPRLGAVGVDTARTPFTNAAHAAWLLAGRETYLPVSAFVTGSWLTRLRVRPLLGILGATVSYAAGHWTIAATPAPVDYDPTPYPRPATPPISAAVPGIPLSAIDPALTFGDLAFLDLPPGRTATTAAPYPGNPT